jgi:hypothetical protein
MSSVTSGVCRGVFICFTCIYSPSSTATFFTDALARQAPHTAHRVAPPLNTLESKPRQAHMQTRKHDKQAMAKRHAFGSLVLKLL